VWELIKGDCLKILRKFSPASIDLLITDPPYNVSMKGNGIANLKGRKDLSMDFGEWDYNFDPIPFLKETEKLLKPDGSMYIFCSHETFAEMNLWCREKFTTRLLIWHKTNPVPSFRKSSWLSSKECILFAYRGNKTFNFDTQNNMHDVLTYPICQGKQRLEHPTQKPLIIIEKFIEISSNEGDTILDPFVGTGTTLEAAERLGRNSIGIEISPKYYDIALKRMKQVEEDNRSLFDCGEAE
jgi:DNA modification methylase